MTFRTETDLCYDAMIDPDSLPAGLVLMLALFRFTCLLPFLLCLLIGGLSGCRSIRRFGDSRQTIDARRLSGQGLQAMHDGRLDAAETLFSEALEVSKSDDRAHWGLAESYWTRGESKQAITHMEQAVRLSAADPKLVRRLGRMYLELGQLEAAREHSQWALDLQRESEAAWALQGDCLHAAGEDEQALAAYHRALALRPDYPQVQLQAAEIYHEQGRYDRVLATLDRLQDDVGIEASPPTVDVLRGIAMRQLGRRDEAQRCFLRAAGKDPTNATPHLEMATLALARGDVDQAGISLEKAIELDPDSVRDSLRVQQLQDQQRRLAEATIAATRR